MTVVHVAESQRGQPLFLLNNLKYSKVKCNLASDELKRRCINRKCKGY